MTTKPIDMELAKSIDPDAWRKIHKDDEEWCQKFADLIRADERNECAKVCESLWRIDGQFSADEFASKVRARGTHDK
jgi:hypothetical protein